jgi:hypothetical protein
MLLQIKVYSNTTEVDASVKEIPEPDQSIYVSLNTSESSTILSVGRKDANVVLGSDKSVSRQHMTLEIVSSKTFEAIDNKPLPRSPRDQIEEHACETDDLVCILKDTSKFGTYVIAQHSFHDNRNKKNSDSTENEETDDEGPNTNQQQSSQLSIVASKLLGTREGKLIRVEEKFILTNLHQHFGQAIIQVGQNGSTLIVQRIPLRIVMSRITKKIKDQWMKRRYLLGMTVLETIDSTTTHLVTDDRVTNVKSLTAWCLSKPLVTMDFLEAMWLRKRSTDPLPIVEEYQPSDGDDGLAFWEDNPNPKLWSHTTMLSFDTRSEDLEALCRAAGAKIVTLYNHSDPLKAIDDSITKYSGCFYLQSNSNTHAKVLKHLRASNIPYVSQKTIARCVSNQEPLKSDGDEVHVIGSPLSFQNPSLIHNDEARSDDNDRESDRPIQIDSRESKSISSMSHSRNSQFPKRETNNHPESQDQNTRGHEKIHSRSNLKATEDTPRRASQLSEESRQQSLRKQQGDDEISSMSLRRSNRSQSTASDNQQSLPPPERTTRSSRHDSKTSVKSQSQNVSNIDFDIDNEEDDNDEDLPKVYSRSQRKARQNQVIQSSITSQESSQLESKVILLSKDADVNKSPQRRSPSSGRQGLGEQSKTKSIEMENASIIALNSRKRNLDTNNEEAIISQGTIKVSKLNSDGWTDVRKAALTKFSQPFTSAETLAGESSSGNTSNIPRQGEIVNVPVGLRQALPKTTDGWMVAAPRDRTAFLATEAEILDSLEDPDNLPPKAETVVLPGLIIENVAKAPRIQPQKQGTVKDFRGFRKNPIIRVGNVACIQLRAVLPRESDRQMELQDEQALLEANMREADLLFQDSSRGQLNQFKSRSRVRDV